jgi:hypothetical protein
MQEARTMYETILFEKDGVERDLVVMGLRLEDVR